MLVLSRKNQEAVVISGANGLEQLLKVTVLESSGGRVKLGFEAHKDFPIHRAEVWERMRTETENSHPKPVAPLPGYMQPYID
jgi:carbon storage regulator CsrA